MEVSLSHILILWGKKLQIGLHCVRFSPYYSYNRLNKLTLYKLDNFIWAFSSLWNLSSMLACCSFAWQMKEETGQRSIPLFLFHSFYCLIRRSNCNVVSCTSSCLTSFSLFKSSSTCFWRFSFDCFKLFTCSSILETYSEKK